MMQNNAENTPNYQTDADIRQYLNSKDRQARQTMTRLREGTNELRIGQEDIQSQTETEDWK